MQCVLKSMLLVLVLHASASQAFDFKNVVVGQKFNAARAGIALSPPAPSSKSTPAHPLQERFADSVIARKTCHVIVTTTAKDDVVQDILIYWSGTTEDVLDSLEKKFGKPAAHFIKRQFINGRGLRDAISSWSDGSDVIMEFHSMDGDSPYISMSTKSFIAGQ